MSLRNTHWYTLGREFCAQNLELISSNMWTMIFFPIRHIDLGLTENGINFYMSGRDGMLTFVAKMNGGTAQSDPAQGAGVSRSRVWGNTNSDSVSKGELYINIYM